MKTQCTGIKLTGNTQTGTLKIIALVCMIIDHVGVIFFPHHIGLRTIGRIAFPLYAWSLVVGSIMTHHPMRYTLRLFGVGCISQPLYCITLNHSLWELNILFTLCLGLVAIMGIRYKCYGSQFWAPILCYVIVAFVTVDYGWKGLTFMLVLYGARQSKSALAVAFLSFALYWGAGNGVNLIPYRWSSPILSLIRPLFSLRSMVWLALPFILYPTPWSIAMPKWLGYLLYPLHLLVLYLIKLLV